MSDSSDEDSHSDGSQTVPAKRPRTDTYGASSTTSHGSEHHESEDDHSDNNLANSYTANEHSALLFKERSESVDNIRSSRSSGNCSSPSDQCETFRPGFGDQDDDSEATEQQNYGYDSQSGNSDLGNAVQGEYSEKAQKMMSSMGYKPGKGLGKFGHGRVEPVEASNQKGRRGLGLKPSLVGNIPRDFKWSPDDAKAEAREEVAWMDSAPTEKLTGDVLDDWMVKGPKKLTIADETEFVDEDILKGVLNAKNIFDTLDDEDLRHARFRSNPYETIGAVMFLNRAAVKMANLDAVYDFMFTNPKNQSNETVIKPNEILYFADVCAGPGGFSEYVLYRKGWKAKGFGFTLKGSNDFKLSDFYAGPPETFNPYYGVEGDGNVFNPANLTSLREDVLKHTDDMGVHFLMADGGFSVEGQENIQEILSKQLYLCQCLAALMLVRTGGHFVVKLFDVFTRFSVGLIYIMYRCFDKVSIHKPVTSRPANSERYLVCKWKRADTDSVERHLYSVNSILWKERDKNVDVTELVPLSVIKEDKAFYEYICNSNCVLGEKQIKNLLKIAEFSKNKSLKELIQAEMKEQCLKLWQLPDKVRTQPERSGHDSTLAAILSAVKHRPPEAHSPQAFKTTILGKQPQYIEGAADLKLFKSVYDWHFMFLSSGKNNPDLTFFMGCGGKQVFQLKGSSWTNVVDLQLTLPAKTLIYGELIKEFRGEGNNQVHCKALHVIDALMLGGVDVSHHTVTERHAQCAMFCAAVNKPFEPQALPIRCKRLFNMENFSSAINHLENRAMKRIRKAVTITVPNQVTRNEMFYVVGSIVFIKEIGDQWTSRISKKHNQKYYYGPLDKSKSPRSEFHIPSEARLDMISAYTGRAMWQWEPATAVLDGAPHPGLTRAQMEQFVQQNVSGN